MKEFQLSELMKILDNFYFLIHENYRVKEVTIGLRAYPSVIFKNHQFGIEVHVIGADLGCEYSDYHIYYYRIIDTSEYWADILSSQDGGKEIET